MNQDPNIIDVTPTPRPSKGSWTDAVYRWWMPRWRRLRGPFWIILFVGLFLVGWLFDSIFINVYPGNAGVLWRRFSGGTDLERVYGGGLWIVNPFNRFYIYETRLQQRETEFTALDTNGLMLNVLVSVRFRPIIPELPLLHEQVGPDYIDRVVIHQVQSVVRKVLGAYTRSQIYGSQNNILQNIVFMAQAELRARHIELDDLLIREVRLPEKMQIAIENKLEQEEMDAAYDAIVDREHKEAERKQIEAEGIAQFQKTIAGNITENYLKLREIEAELELAKSNNSKVIILGGGQGGLPFILNAEDAAAGLPHADRAPAGSAEKAPPGAAPAPAKP